jgi:methionyl-tRNA formyltransferase
MLAWIPKLLENNYTLYQQHGEPTYYPKRTPEDGRIDWSKTVFELYNFIRALTKPYPGAFTYIDERKIMIWKAQPFDTRISYFGKKEGEIVRIFDDGAFVVNCNSGLLLVTEYEGSISDGDILGG